MVLISDFFVLLFQLLSHCVVSVLRMNIFFFLKFKFSRKLEKIVEIIHFFQYLSHKEILKKSYHFVKIQNLY